MASLSTASLPFPFHSFFPNPTRAKIIISLPSSPKLRRRPPVRAQVFTDTLAAAAAASPSPVGGDVSVLLPVSAVLLLVYWVANFVVPGLIIRDFGKEGKGLDGEKKAEE